MTPTHDKTTLGKIPLSPELRWAIRHALHQAGLTRMELARRLGAAPSTITRIIDGPTKSIFSTLLARIADKLNTTVEGLLRAGPASQGRLYEYDVFLSHNSADKPRARHIAEKLRDEGLKVWFDEWIIRSGDDIYMAIEKGLEASRKLILCMSKAAFDSDWVGLERATAMFRDPASKDRRFIPVLLEDCDIPEVIRRFKYMDLRESEPATIDRIIARCRPESNWDQDEPLTGGPRVSIAHLPNTGEHLCGRDAMLKQLDDAWSDTKTNVFALVAGGGVGKSALVNRWLSVMGQDGYRGARRVYGYSFYSQGTSDGTASADAFFAEALAWFGDPDPTKGSAWARGERLAELVRAERTLLILDGMEPLQFPPGSSAGRVTDPGLQALLRELAAANPGLCVVTTRVHVVDLDRFAGAGVVQQDLEDLPNEAGAELLKQLGIDGSPEERAKASEEFGNHALALTLLGSYLVKACNGDIRRQKEISLIHADTVRGGHARKVMASYEKWFTMHGRESELSILRILGLFYRAAEAGCIAALREGEPIANLTTGLANISDADWNIALANLREAGLLAEEDEENRGALDAHPLVREHFAERLEKDYPEAWKAGHERLYEYLIGPGCKKDLPDTADEMTPLYAAVLHGCAAGRHQEVLDDVYYRRIQRGNELHNTRKLGAFGADLGALVGLFEEPWRRPVASLSERTQAFVLNRAGMNLLALGRLRDAVEPMLAVHAVGLQREDWGNAARYSGNLSALHLTLGRISEALDYAKQSVDFAGRMADAFQRLSKLATLADTLHQAGRASEALELFEEAERMQIDDEPKEPFLYSLRGYRYCDLLLGGGDHHGVIERATRTMEIAERSQWLLDIALNHLSLARAHLLAARAEGTDAYKKAWAHIDLAVDGLRDAGQLDDLPRGLLARAELYLFTGDHAEARAALNEAMDIATRDPQGHMKLFVTDCHLGYARLALAEKEPDVATEHLAQARALIEETGYHRRDAELAELEAEAGGPADSGA